MVLKFVMWIAGKVAETVDRETRGSDAIRRDLLSLSEDLGDDGTLSEREYKEQEERVLERLEY